MKFTLYNLFKLSTLGNRLILSFATVALLPLLLLAFLDREITRKALTEKAQENLLRAASQTALSLDNFLSTNLDVIRTQAQLPDFINYLSYPQLQTEENQTEVKAILQALSRKDVFNIYSYSLLDRNGKILVDTVQADVGKTINDDSFKESLYSGAPTISELEYIKFSSDPHLHFNQPVRADSGQIVGFLRLTYKGAVLQRLVAQNWQGVSKNRPNSLAILVDDKSLILAHSVQPELLYKSLVPLPNETFKSLQKRGRIPPDSAENLSLNLIDLHQGLKNAKQSPVFNITVDLTGNKQHISRQTVAVVALATKPWQIIFVQSQASMLNAVKEQELQTLWLVMMIVIGVVIAAIITGQILTKPIVSLKETVSKFTAGDLQARSFIDSKDEIGKLAASFNKMATEISILLGRLEERTKELEQSQSVTLAVSQLSGSIFDPQQLLKDAIAIMQSRFGLKFVEIYQLEPNTKKLIPQNQTNQFARALLTLDQENSLIAEAARSQKIIALNPEQKGDIISSSQAAIPLIARGNLLGVIAVENQAKESFNSLDLETFSTLAGQIATALENAQLLAEVQKAEMEYREQAQELAGALEQLQKTQMQLIQTEKMSSLGQLVAGVAHEINNPVNFIYGNLNHANNYLNDLATLINLYQKNYPDPSPEIKEYSEIIDLNFLLEDVEKILGSMKLGAERIRQIVISLRNFSRLDESEIKAANLHEGLESTLIILQNRLHENWSESSISVVKDYHPLPLVECYPGQLNQVFMNLINNAIDALEEQYKQMPASARSEWVGTIVISTSALTGDLVEVRIKDNGLGISNEVKSRIFDPFFTTKDVGKGTGLGLAISYQIIVEKHQGELYCLSEPGQGAEFVIILPVKMV